MNPQSPYDQKFFEGRSQRVQNSAKVLVKLMHELFSPSSVVDVGCGDGAWLAEWAKLGVKRIQGVDGHWVDQSVLKIPLENFRSHDLNRTFTLEERFDLCTSFEVAEHLAPENGTTFVQTLTQLSDIVVFSAAIPGQGGTGHINERWQEYWIDLFERCGYVARDALSQHVWLSDEVQPCYLQNTLVYVKADALHRYPDIQQLPALNLTLCGRRVHPRVWAEKVTEAEDLARFGLVRLLKALPKAVSSSVVSRLTKR